MGHLTCLLPEEQVKQSLGVYKEYTKTVLQYAGRVQRFPCAVCTALPLRRLHYAMFCFFPLRRLHSSGATWLCTLVRAACASSYAHPTGALLGEAGVVTGVSMHCHLGRTKAV